MLIKGTSGYSSNQNISSWDTSNVTDMSTMFANATILTPLWNYTIGWTIGNSWDTSNVTNILSSVCFCSEICK